MKKFGFLLLLSVLVIGCAPKQQIYYDLPYEFRFPEQKAEFVKDYSQYIKGKTVFIDPGHGGSDERGAVGNLSIVEEAIINYKVASNLKKFIEQAGGKVIMSRYADSTVDLKERSVRANNSGADIFISIHHNAPANDSLEWVNYTATYYHAYSTDYEFEPCQNDMAKYIERDIAYAVRNSGGPGSFDGTYSDYDIYPKAGFSVLRHTKIPSVLVECAFVTNNYQEKKLALEQYNEIEAWGIFKGLCRYFAQGIPTITYAPQKNDVKTVESFYIKDATGIKSNSLVVYVDSVRTNNFIYTKETGLLQIKTNDLAEGDHIIRIIAENKKGNHSFPFYKKIKTVK